jgi:hypothetical protein
MRPVPALVICLTFGLGCAPPPQAGKGGKCHAISDCKPGLACVEGKCTSDLSAIEGDVPDYPAETPVATDAGAQDATPP